MPAVKTRRPQPRARARRTAGGPPAKLKIRVDATTTVSGLLQVPPDARAVLVLAHGAGAGMTHSFLAAFAAGLAEAGIATLRYQFPYMERGSRRPDRPEVAHATVRAAVAAVRQRLPKLPCFAGGKSFGGRMTSQAQAIEPLPGILGLVFVGFPLHPAGKPSIDRAAHLDQVRIPMLFLQGTDDDLAELKLLRPVCRRLRRLATLRLFAHADHAFHVPARTGRKGAEVMTELVATAARWMENQAETTR